MKRLKPIKYSLLYKGAFIDLCAIGILLNFLSLEQPFFMTLSYYTILSNLACLIYMTFLFIREWRGLQISQNHIRLKGGFTVMIFLTFVIYHFLLRPVIIEYGTDYEVFQLSDILVHYLAPLMVFFDFLFFTQHKQLKRFDPFWWLLIPLIYWVYTLIYALLGGRFVIGEDVSRVPYFFLSFEDWGFFGVLLWVFVIMILYLILGYGLIGIDHLMHQLKIRKQRN
ncbi:MAG: hypothetical protein CVV56_06100 [Tenericutes bacterium HGW-Tenericutes-1]|jgi:hypothetical protein|nr:MAG: hypothetical protein CVV56_06100 [Tenericutes bacterium HGW-Tenericutes-1]